MADASTESWRALTAKWLTEQYPDAEITTTNGGIGGTGSSYGLANIIDLLKLQSETEKPDLVFIEYAVNDYYNEENALASTSIKNNLEYIIRTIYGYAPDADIILVLTGELANMNIDYKAKAAHMYIAERFKLPYISVAEMLWNDMVVEGNFFDPASGVIWSTYFGNDWVHPNAAGNAKYAQYINNYMSEIFAAKTAIPQGTVNSYKPLKTLDSSLAQ